MPELSKNSELYKMTRERLMERGAAIRQMEVKRLPESLQLMKPIDIQTPAELFKPEPKTRPPNLADIAFAGVHHEINQVEDENIGLEAAHQTEKVVEIGVRNFPKKYHYQHIIQQDKPTRGFQRSDNLNNKTALQKRRQKKAMKKAFDTNALQTEKTLEAAKKAGQSAGALAANLTKAVSSHPIFVGIGIFLILVVVLAFGLLSSCSNFSIGGAASIFVSSYLAEDVDLNDAELNYTKWESELQMRVLNAENDYPSYDEYRVHTDNIGHNPYELLSYLTAVYQDFIYPEIEAELLAIFNQQYSFYVEPSVEIRTRTYEKTGTKIVEGENGELNEETYTYTVDVEFEWHVLTITLTAKNFADLIAPLMNEEQADHYEQLTKGHGNRQYAVNPLDSSWLMNVIEPYGYSETGFSDGITIATPNGLDVHAGFDGQIMNSDGGTLILSNQSVTIEYSGLSEIFVHQNDTVSKNDVIAKTGTSLRIVIMKTGVALNPIIFVETGGESNEIVFGEPGEPMSDSAFEALMVEARKHLGKPYIFGASGPNSFDCSGFVCYVLNHSGVASVGRTTAQGLFNTSNPISRDDARPGDLIFFEGTYSSQNKITHVGIYLGNGLMINAGDPVKYADIDSAYWQSHYYAMGRLS